MEEKLNLSEQKEGLIGNILGVGVDIESIKRFKEVDKNFLDLVFTRKEIEYCQKKKEPEISFAGKFCAKEAVIKAYLEKILMKTIEIINLESGQPIVFINGKKKESIMCSISHSGEYAVAFVVIKDDF